MILRNIGDLLEFYVRSGASSRRAQVQNRRGKLNPGIIGVINEYDDRLSLKKASEAEVRTYASELLEWCQGGNSDRPMWMEAPAPLLVDHLRLPGQAADFISIVPLACGLFRRGSEMLLSMRHYDIQIQAALNLLAGDSLQMDTGEGKTIVIGMAAYLKFLFGCFELRRGHLHCPSLNGASSRSSFKNAPISVHVATANTILANRDAQWLIAES